MPSRKKVQRTIRIPGDLEEEITKLAKSLHQVGLLPEPNWSAALIMVLLQARQTGLLETPPKWYTAPEEPEARPRR